MSKDIDDWTIDTMVLYSAARGCVEAEDLLIKLRGGQHHITLDFEGKIEKEYYVCFNSAKREPNYNILKWWWRNMEKFGRFVYQSGKMSNRNKMKLLNELKFDRNDVPFVEVCRRSAKKRLVSEDRHYNDKVKNYLSSTLKVQVLSIHQAAKI